MYQLAFRGSRKIVAPLFGKSDQIHEWKRKGRQAAYLIASSVAKCPHPGIVSLTELVS